VSVGYTTVQWSGHKKVYDAAIVLAVVAFVGVYALVSARLWSAPSAVSAPVLVMRATGACAITLLHVILCIGPLARLDPRWLPVLYNRRHLGVSTFLVALAHAIVAVGFYHGFGVVNPLLSLLTINIEFASLRGFPYQLLGLGALAIMFVLAATSHDFWLKNLPAGLWKRLHMMVYVAYVLLVGHVGLGALQNDRGVMGPALVACGVVLVSTLHVWAGLRERKRDVGAAPTEDWIDAGAAADMPMDRARTVCTPGGERIAVFKHKDGISAVTNVCAHQGGPLGEGRIIDGCITCPWHGWQYKPGDGCSPPPFEEKIATYQVRIVSGRVQVKSGALPPGTPTPPAREDAHG
jgi:sulfoxide reductase heme-binding subunit YedZ